MARVENVKELQTILKKLRKESKRKDDGSVIVGYTANYALAVHETFEPAPGATRKARTKGQQGKFLEQPARTLVPELKRIVSKIAPVAGIIKALVVAGLRIQRESQLLVPVDSGNLKGSAFIAIDRGKGRVLGEFLDPIIKE